MSLYIKYRPQTLDEIIGNDNLKETLESMLTNIADCPHAFLLEGPTGCGKTTIARIIAKRLNCVGSDFREIDSADFRGIDTIREMRRNSQYSPLESNLRLWLIDECHKLTNDAQNALLKILEDTPAHVYFVLCTTEPQKLIPTIRGRCSRLVVDKLTERQMMRLLKKIVHSEKQKIDTEVYEQIIQDSFCHPRNALQILDQVLKVAPENQLKMAKHQAEQQSQSIELCRALIKNSGWKQIRLILEGLKQEDAENIRRHVLGYCQSILLKEDNERAALVLEHFWEPFYNIGFPGLVYSCYVTTKS